MATTDALDKVQETSLPDTVQICPVSPVSDSLRLNGKEGGRGADDVDDVFEMWMREGISADGIGKRHKALGELTREVEEGLACWGADMDGQDETGVEWGGMLEDILDVDSKSMAFHEEEVWGVGTASKDGLKVGAAERGSDGLGKIKKKRKGDGRKKRDKKTGDKKMADKQDEVNKAAPEVSVAEHKDGALMDKCVRCAKTRKDTPMMRKGPDGGRNLCNACGLKWSRHGIF